MDVLSLHAAGIKNVVSNSGIAITENQIDLKSRLSILLE